LIPKNDRKVEILHKRQKSAIIMALNALIGLLSQHALISSTE